MNPSQKPAAVLMIERHNYAVTSVPGFLSSLPPADLEARARSILAEHFPGIAPHTLCVLYDAAYPDGSISRDSYMLIGPDPEGLALECTEHLDLAGADDAARADAAGSEA